MTPQFNLTAVGPTYQTYPDAQEGFFIDEGLGQWSRDTPASHRSHKRQLDPVVAPHPLSCMWELPDREPMTWPGIQSSARG